MASCSCGPGVLLLINYATGRYGTGVNSGCVGNDDHTYGYHLCPSRIRSLGRWGSDYSTQLLRDRSPAGDHSVAFDLAMSWSRSREWLAWFVTQARAGKYPDVCEIIGSLDGETALYWRGPAFVTERYTGDGHVAWSHIGFWRDASLRDQSPILRNWVGIVTPPVPPVIPPVEGGGTDWIFTMANWKDETIGAPPPGWMGGPRDKIRIGDWYGAIPGYLTGIRTALDNIPGLLTQVTGPIVSNLANLTTAVSNLTTRVAALEGKVGTGTGGGGGTVDVAAVARASAAELGARISRPLP